VVGHEDVAYGESLFDVAEFFAIFREDGAFQFFKGLSLLVVEEVHLDISQ
jgi:hypothetical protein